MSEQATRDPYRRRRAAAAASREETRRRLLESADRLFREQGYSRSSVSAIADSAGVSLQTLYLAWGSKAALLRAAAYAAVTTAELPIEPEEWRRRVVAELASGAGGAADARAALAVVSGMFVRVALRAAPYWRMIREAAGTDEGIATDWTMITEERWRTMEAVVDSMPTRGLRPELVRDDIVHTLWSLASPEVYELFTAHRGLSAGDFEAWLTRTLQTALCT